MGDADPPYLVIAAELRRAIETGTLEPGERVPSTREITRRWGVAMATASKALAALRRDGLVRPVPGVGTVVADRPEPRTAAGPTRAPVPRRRTSDIALSLQRIVRAAVAVADAEGLAGLSMRRVSTELRAAPMSLYRHIADKDDLVARMVDAVLSGMRFPADLPGGWRPRLALAARMLWAVFRRHPWLAPALSLTRPQPVAAGLAYSEWVLGALDAHGVDADTAFTAHLALFTWVRGTALNLDAEAQAEAETGMTSEEWMAAREPALRSSVESGRYPVFAGIVTGGYDFDLDGLFDFGLRRMLDGLSSLLDR